jgi:hypothetical protein
VPWDFTVLLCWKGWEVMLHPTVFVTPWHHQTQRLKVKRGKCVPLHAMKAPGGEEEKLLLILNLGTRWGWVVSITPRPPFTPGERTPGTHWTGGWVGPRAGLDAEARRKILYLCRGSNPGRPVRSQTLYWLSYCGYSEVKGESKCAT